MSDELDGWELDGWELDDWLRAALWAEVPERPTGFFDALDARLAAPATKTATPDVTVDRGRSVDAARDARPSSLPLRWRRWSVLAAAALVVVAVALAVPALGGGGDEQVDTGFVSQPEGTQFDLAQLDELPGPTQNLDQGEEHESAKEYQGG